MAKDDAALPDGEGFYEVVMETGSFSTAYYASTAEAIEAARLQTERAKTGLRGGPTNHPAERVKRLLYYGLNDPGTTSAPAEITEAEAVAKVREAFKRGPQTVFQVQTALNPQPISDTPPHESNYSAQEISEVPASEWGGD